MKKPRKWTPMSSTRFVLDTAGLTVEEVGAFSLIWSFLVAQHGAYRLEERGLAQIARVSVFRWRKMAPRVMRMFVVDGQTVSLPPKATRYKSLPIATKKFVFGRDGNRCRYCGTTEGDFHIDHIVPRARGGSDDASNLCVACAPCNHSKNALPLEEWTQ